MVLDRKTHFFLGKRWFWTGKPGFVFGFFWEMQNPDLTRYLRYKTRVGSSWGGLSYIYMWGFGCSTTWSSLADMFVVVFNLWHLWVRVLAALFAQTQRLSHADQTVLTGDAYRIGRGMCQTRFMDSKLRVAGAAPSADLLFCCPSAVAVQSQDECNIPL